MTATSERDQRKQDAKIITREREGNPLNGSPQKKQKMINCN